MRNAYKPEKAKIIGREEQNADTVLFRLKLPADGQKAFEFLPGQFMQVGLMGWREAPISLCSNPKEAGDYFELTIRGIGRITKKLISLKINDFMLVRGPFGNGFPEAIDKNLILIGGGCGFAPLRSIIEYYSDRQEMEKQIFIGCSSKDTLYFKNSFAEWQKNYDLNLILEKGRLPKYSPKSGFVSDLLNKDLVDDALFFVVGPPVMYKAVVKKLLAKKISPESIYLSLEKRMYCGQGVCQHCAIGSKYICQDGPVFSLAELDGVTSIYKPF
ncbi:MAG TPA: FAD/NAD(P)-binding protein [Candidatus Bipolaricaulota bacterium]|nr:FAD/NAD(P)-binding protein [Candidatus Bipolaricaulota bacterium]